MQAIVSLLDEEHRSRLQELWKDLKETFGLQSRYTRFLPHFSYQVSADYPADTIRRTLEEFTAGKEPFTVKTAGIGLFTQPRTVLFLPVVRNSRLTLFHSGLWHDVCPTNPESNIYHPDRWMPHITLVYGNLIEEELGTIVNYLAPRIINWEITIDNLALIDDTVLDEKTEFTLPLTAT